jgi:hypothetical protein
MGEWHQLLGTILFLTCYYSYYKACTTDPGFIVAHSHKEALERFKFDYVIFAPES